MQTFVKTQRFNCTTDYFLENLKAIDLNQMRPFFEALPPDPYLAGNYRFRRLSRFKVVNKALAKLPHNCLFQSKDYNSLFGDIVREYSELDDRLIALNDFQKIVLEFFEFCQLCSTSDEIAVHQIRTVAYPQQIGNPAPEGIHRDGVDLVGIFCVYRGDIVGGKTYLYKSKDGQPMFAKVLNPGDFSIFNDRQFFHFTSSIKAMLEREEVRDVFVLTCPGLLPPDTW